MFLMIVKLIVWAVKTVMSNPKQPVDPAVRPFVLLSLKALLWIQILPIVIGQIGINIDSMLAVISAVALAVGIALRPMVEKCAQLATCARTSTHSRGAHARARTSTHARGGHARAHQHARARSRRVAPHACRQTGRHIRKSVSHTSREPSDSCLDLCHTALASLPTPSPIPIVHRLPLSRAQIPSQLHLWDGSSHP